MRFCSSKFLSAPLQGISRFLRPERLQVEARCCQSTSSNGIQLPLSGHDISDYEHERRNVSFQAPEYFNFVTDFVDKWAHAEQVTLIAY